MNKFKLKFGGCEVDTESTANGKIIRIKNITPLGAYSTRTLEYNDYGQLIKNTCENTVIEYKYDTYNRLVQETESIGPFTKLTVNYTYENDCVTKIVKHQNFTSIYKTDSNMNIIYHEMIYSDNAIHRMTRQFDYKNKCFIDDTVWICDDQICGQSISRFYYDDNMNVIKKEEIKA